jgi:hypothetical protein
VVLALASMPVTALLNLQNLESNGSDFVPR